MNDPRRLARLLSAGVLGALLLHACSSTKEEEEVGARPPVEELKVYVPMDEPEVKPIGAFLNDLDWTMRQWSKLMLEARSNVEKRRATMLESNLRHYSRLRFDELIAELETGVPKNRVIAAAALGFSDSDLALSPLLGALEDRDNRVVSNALLALGGLAREDTPLYRLCDLLVTSPDAVIRTNAASAARAVITAHGEATKAREEKLAEEELRENPAELPELPELDDCILDAARGGLVDDDPGVRSQCILLLAALTDTDSIREIEGSLHDDVPLVQAAAARALAVIGIADVEHKGRCARALAGAMRRADPALYRRIIHSLSLMSEVVFEDDEEWGEWARRLP